MVKTGKDIETDYSEYYCLTVLTNSTQSVAEYKENVFGEREE
jgi:hypothetical protein